MADIIIISSSVRQERKSHRVALFFQKFIESRGLGKPEILDLMEKQFPLFDQRLSRMKNPKSEWVEFSERINRAKGVIIVTPEYNGGYPASLKNIIDFMYKEWHRKPMAIATVSDGQYGGTQVIQSLQFTLWKIGAWVVPFRYHVSHIDKSYDEEGNSANPKVTDKLAGQLVDELMWSIRAKQKMEEAGE